MPKPSLLPATAVPLFLLLATAALLAGCAGPSVPLAPWRPPATPTQPPAPPTTAPASAAAPPAPDAEQQAAFGRWIEGMRAQARAAGIGEATLDSAFDGVRHLHRVVALDGRQPEFDRTVWDYLDSAVSPQRVARGLEKLRQVQPQADAAEARYGVPATVIAAIWGMESNYGANFGDIPTIDALATLGFDGRREDWARGQLIAALKILQNGDIDRGRMVGSWAGAMGQTQFLPSSFLAYAVDGDGDGRRDIWGSMADVTASTANYLARSGWQTGQPWGYEVVLPAGFDAGRADAALRQSAAQWRAEGLTAAGGGPLPDIRDAALLLPAGAAGPAFLTGPNFRAILRYNNSTSYALGVGLLAQRLAGGPEVLAAWPRDAALLSRSQIQELQTLLNQRGFATGTPDGVMGPASREGVRGWQRSVGLPADGYPSVDMLQRLQSGR